MPIQQMLLGGGGVYTPYVSPYNLTDVPSTSYTNNSVLPGSSNIPSKTNLKDERELVILILSF